MKKMDKSIGGKELTTPMIGGMTPSRHDIMESANARAQKYHSRMGREYPDEGVLPKSGGESLDKAGIQDTGYLDKKGTPYGVEAFFNTLPPGVNIEEQEIADIHMMEMKQITDLGYPGDGWT